jgi:lysophospholipase-3
MIEHLSSEFGYKIGENLFLAPYDWRLAGDSHARSSNGVGGFYKSLKQLIEQEVQQTRQQAVVISHSLGCPTMLFFFQNYVSEAWRRKFISSWVAMSGPFLGSSMQANAYLGGYTFGLPHWLIPHDYARPTQVNASSGTWLSPHPMAFGDLPIVTTPLQNYTAAELPQLLDKTGNKQALALMRKLSSDFSALQTKPSGLHVEHWYSNGVKTAEGFTYDKEISHGFNEAPVSTRYGDGDGIVNLRSLQAVERFWGQGTLTRVFPNVSHFGMLSDARVLGNLTSFLSRHSQTQFDTLNLII